jgi:ATP-dependent helicase/nuclease subunit A
MLLQYLPDVPETDREALAHGYLDRIAADWPETERQMAWQSVRRILDDPTYAPVFAEGSRGEVAIMARSNLRARSCGVGPDRPHQRR